MEAGLKLDIKVLCRMVVAIAGSVLLVSLSGCVTKSSTQGDAKSAGAMESDYAMKMRNAEKSLEDNQADKAMGLFAGAAKIFPDRKEPWQRIAQVQFEHGNYVEAAVAAQEVIQRTGSGNESDTAAARSILAVSGLRLSVRALAELRGGDFLRGDVRREAETLAQKLRTTLNEQVLIPQSLVDVDPSAQQADAAKSPEASAKKKKTSAATVKRNSSSTSVAPAADKSGGDAVPPRSSAVGGASSGDPFGALR